MKVLFFSPLALYNPHLETEMELATLELERGNEVHWISCPGGLDRLCQERVRSSIACIGCGQRKRQAQALLKGVQWRALDLARDSKEVPEFANANEVKNFRYRGVDVGSSVFSTLISLIREPKPDLQEHLRLIRECCEETMRLVDAVFLLLEKGDIDRAYVFNGRMMFFRPVVRVLQQKGIEFFVHERAGSFTRYSLCKSTYPHDLAYKKMEIEDVCAALSPEEVRTRGRAWFEARRKGDPQGWPSFILEQVPGILPGAVSAEEKIISIFVSSEDEFESIDDWNNRIYTDQMEGIRSILRDLPADFRPVIRIHPNLKVLDNSQTRALLTLSSQFDCVVVKAEDSVDTYALIEASHRVVTFGSTVGIEAVFWGKPSILAGGRSFYEDLGAVHTPRTHQEVMEMILDQDLPARGPELALKYGAWESSYGHEFRHFRPDGFFDGSFQGHEIGYGLLYRLIRKIVHLYRRAIRLS